MRGSNSTHNYNLFYLVVERGFRYTEGVFDTPSAEDTNYLVN